MKRRHSKRNGKRKKQKRDIKKRSYELTGTEDFLYNNKKIRPRYHGVHGKGIEQIINRLSESRITYDSIYDNLDYGIEGHSTKGEFDVIAFYDNHILIFEVKGFDTKGNRRKAYEQLARGKKFLSKKADRIYTFYCYFNYGHLRYENIHV